MNNGPITNGSDGVLDGDRPSAGSKVINKVIILALVAIALSLGVMLYWATQSDKVLDIKNAPFPVRTIREHPTADGLLALQVDYCKLQNIKGKLQTSFVSSSREVLLPQAEESGPVGCKNTELPVVIPKSIVPDTYKIKFVVTYDINPLKKDVVQSFESAPVTIVAPGGPGSEQLAPQNP